ncbi:MAG: helix-turn-helix transcriptional regulator [Phycisphaeraceae bacterium]|nr:helix-turn-helix transcriptional regulator [Phycisphaeraceae bacterium]
MDTARSLRRREMTMQRETPRALYHLFPETLWTGSEAGRRSHEPTPVFVDRYRGPRLSDRMTAHDFWELSVVIAGRGTLTAERNLPLKPNTAYMIPPRVPHGERGGEQLDTIWVCFHWRAAPAKIRRHPPQTVESPSLVRFIEQLWLFSKQQGGGIGPELDGMTATAMHWFLRLKAEGGPEGEGGLARQALRYFEHHATEPVSVPDLARHLGCSEGHLHRTFKRETGLSPVAYLTRMRIRRATLLLTNTDRPIAAIAAMVGFDNPFYFSRVFHRITGLAPTAYRQRASPSTM